MTMNRKAFFDAVRDALFGGGLTNEQVRGVETLLDTWGRVQPAGDLRYLAYILATVFHETGRKMVPVREGFASTDAAAQRAVASLYAKGRISVNYALPVNGVSYYGRGRVQNTWERNYRKLQERFGHPFVTQPDLLLDNRIDAEVTIIGHLEGIWTGKKLSDYFRLGLSDPYNARRIVNGLDKASEIAGYYHKFYAALTAAQVAEPDPPPKPVTRAPAPAPQPATSGGLFAALVSLLKRIFG
ncbi:hypothetical protein ACFOYU_11215 [Microvirga sp. GCM10011540]|uniref:hypothetical protein n=1 Tax=Microvirga sp. GCM10011540 TaxID=3317338 RepID=UPI003607C7EC